MSVSESASNEALAGILSSFALEPSFGLTLARRMHRFWRLFEAENRPLLGPIERKLGIDEPVQTQIDRLGRFVVAGVDRALVLDLSPIEGVAQDRIEMPLSKRQRLAKPALRSGWVNNLLHSVPLTVPYKLRSNCRIPSARSDEAS